MDFLLGNVLLRLVFPLLVKKKKIYSKTAAF